MIAWFTLTMDLFKAEEYLSFMLPCGSLVPQAKSFQSKHTKLNPSMRTSCIKVIAIALGILGARQNLRAASPLYAEAAGVVAVEAEHFSSRTDQSEDPQHGYKIIPTEDPGDQEYKNARGGQYIQVLPNSGDNANVTERVNNAPYVDYQVFITTPGTYRLWLRWGGYSGDSDSAYAQIVELMDGAGGANQDWYRFSRNINDATAGDNDFNRGWDSTAAPEAIDGGPGGGPATWNIVNPGVYTIRLHMREDAAAFDTVLLQLSSKADPTNPGPAESALATAFISFTTQPKDAAITPGTAASFTVAATGSGALSYQWQKAAAGTSTFTDIAGATSTTYTTGNQAAADEGTQYRVNVTTGSLTLPSAVGKVVFDQNPPTVVGALGSPDLKSVTVRFNEKVSPGTAETLANYTVSGLTLSNPKLQANGTDVILTTTTQTASTPYTLTINGIKDAAGNTANNLTAKFAGATLVPGGVLQKFFNNVTGNTIDSLRNDARYPDNPTFTTVESRFEYPANGANEAGSNYGNILSGWLVPPVTGDYVFFTCSDDPSELFLSIDENPANKKLIAIETAWSTARHWIDSDNTGTDLPSKRSDQFPGTEWPQGATITLTAGKSYYIEVLHTEGGGGDNVGVNWMKPGDTEPAFGAPPIDGKFIKILADPTASINITQQPTNTTAAAATSASFSVAYTAFSAFGTNAAVQWQKAPAGSSTFTDIPGATTTTYNIAFAAPSDNGAQYRAALTASGTTVTSSAATLTVSADTAAPTIAGVNGTASFVLVSFNEPLDAPSAANKANYTIAGGVTVNGATVLSASGAAGVVRLDITGATAGNTYDLTVNGVKDLSNNAMSSTVRSFVAFNIFANFNDGKLPTGAAVSGNANVQPSGSFDGSAFVELTPSQLNQQGGLYLPDSGTASANKLTATWKMFIGQGSGNAADGVSFVISPGLDEGATFGEEGTGTGLVVSFDTYDNGNAEAPAIYVKFGGVSEETVDNGGNQVVKTNLAKGVMVNNLWVDVSVQVTADGKVSLIHNNVKYFDSVPIPNWAPIDTPRAAFGARTGNEREAAWIDDVAILYNADLALAQPPSIVITSPANNATFPAGATVPITVNAQAPGGTVTKVEFFANGQSIGSSTTAPYSFAVPNAPQGAYLVSARITDARGVTVSSAPIKVVVGNPEKILFVTADPGPLTFPGDQAVYEHLLSRGYDVELARGMDVPDDGSTANGKILIVQSSSLGSGTVVAAAGGHKFKDTAIPVMEWEASNIDDYGFASVNGITVADQTQITIRDASTPLTAGLPAGPTTVVTSPQVVSVGSGAATDPVGAHIVATTADPTQPVLFYYDKGEKGFEDFVMPARRAFFFFQDNTATAANENGWKIFDATMDWLLNKSSTGGGEKPTAGISISGNSVTVTSSAGGTVEATDSLSPTNWQAVGPAPQTISITGKKSQFFRIKK
jgi:hypothetical protein